MISRIRELIADPSLLLNYVYLLPAILIGLTVHEWAHAFAAYKLGDPTARNLGRMTLNPLAHIDPFGFICLLLVGFGWAKPVPVNPRNFKNYKRDDIIVSLAGIIANFVTAFVFSFIYVILLRLFNLADNMAFHSIFSGIIVINLSLMLFNIIPIYPLDGSHIMESLLIRKAPRFIMFMRQYGMYILIALLLFGVVGDALSFLVSNIRYGLLTAAVWVTGLF